MGIKLCHDDGMFAWVMDMESYISLKLRPMKLDAQTCYYMIIGVSKYTSEESFSINVSDPEVAANIFENVVALYHLAGYDPATRDPIIKKCNYISLVPIAYGLYDLNF